MWRRGGGGGSYSDFMDRRGKDVYWGLIGGAGAGDGEDYGQRQAKEESTAERRWSWGQHGGVFCVLLQRKSILEREKLVGFGGGG